MQTVTLEPELLTQVSQLVGDSATTLEDFVNEAVRAQIDRMADEILEREIAAFEGMYPHLRQTHFGQYVAIHNGQLVDSDPDFESLFLRTQAKLGTTPVLVRRVTQTATPELRAPGSYRHRSLD